MKLPKPLVIVSSAMIGVVVFVGAKIFQYSSTPTKAREYSYNYPTPYDQSKPTTIELTTDQLIDFAQRGGNTNDASHLNKTPIFGIVKIRSEEDAKKALAFAKKHDINITAAGKQHSMGGHSFSKNGLILDMKEYKNIIIHKEQKTITVQSGATWQDVQDALDKEGLAVKSMQSINIFTVGGTLSVNAHGLDPNPGPIAPTVKSLKVLRPDGSIVIASKEQNADLFRSVIGGYGLFGIILEAEIEVIDNASYLFTRDIIDYTELADYYVNNVYNNPDTGLFLARLSMSSDSYLKETFVYNYRKTPITPPIGTLQEQKHTTLQRFLFNLSKTGAIGKNLRWWAERHFEHTAHQCTRNEIMSQPEDCIVVRNQEMYDEMKNIKSNLNDTDILQEYFIPHDKVTQFIDQLRDIVIKNDANLLNVNIRGVRKDTVTSLPYAKQDMVAFVLYFNQKFNDTESKALQQTTTDLIDAATALDGTYYLPYQLYYTKEQLRSAYPEIDTFFAKKKQNDPEEIFTNLFYEKYGKEN